MENSKIEWTDHTANFWWGCMKVSAGCQHCYAETWANRWGKSIWGPAATTDREYKKAAWVDLPRWDAQARAKGVRHRVFVQSMSDFFEDHPQVATWRTAALELMQHCRNLDFQILTKRPENIIRMVSEKVFAQGLPSNIWIGTSVENQEAANKRIPELMQIPAAVRFLSCEPLLGPVDFSYEDDVCHCGEYVKGHGWQLGHGAIPVICSHLEGIDWVIAGAESGPGARPMSLDWVRSLRDQCQAAGTAFFFKQMLVNGHKVSLPELDGQQWAQFPEVTA